MMDAERFSELRNFANSHSELPWLWMLNECLDEIKWLRSPDKVAVVADKQCLCEDTESLVKVIWGDCTPDSNGAYEWCGITRCDQCGRLWKWRYQCHPGTGSDHFRVGVGETVSHMSFTQEEADEVLKEIAEVASQPL